MDALTKEDYERAEKTGKLQCPRCEESCSRDSYHNGYARIYGPWGCYCGWSEGDPVDKPSGSIVDDSGYRVDQWGIGHPPGCRCCKWDSGE